MSTFNLLNWHVVVLVLAVNKYSKKVTKMSANMSADLFCNTQLLEDRRDQSGDQSDSPYLPSCPPLPPPPPYTAVDNLHPNPPPSYSLLIPRST